MEPASRNGLSLARNGCPLSGASIPGSKVLTCYFAACRLISPPGPPSAPLPPLVCPTWWQLLRFRPVAASLAGSLGCFLCLHSPPGLLPPSGSKRSTDSAASRLAFRIRPISSRSPLPVLFLGLASDHRSWIATFPETCCSSNLLEPHSLCATRPFSSTDFLMLTAQFPQHLSALFLICYSEWPWNLLWIKQGAGIVLLRPFPTSRDRMPECSFPPESANTNSKNSWVEACLTCTARGTR